MITDDYNVASPILEANSYYPFGLQQKGIGLEAALQSQHNKYLFNSGAELQEDLGIDLYATNFRGLDPQLGRFWQQDPLSITLAPLSPYQFSVNNPILFNDPLGLDTVRINGEGHHQIKISNGDILAVTVNGSTGYYNYKDGSYTSTGEAESTDDNVPTVAVSAKAHGEYQSSYSLYATTDGENGWYSEASGYNNIGKYAAFESNFKAFTASYYKSIGYSSFDLGGEADAFKGRVSTRLGTKNIIYLEVLMVRLRQQMLISLLDYLPERIKNMEFY